MASRRPLLLRFNSPPAMAETTLVFRPASMLLHVSTLVLLASLLVASARAQSQAPQYIATVWQAEQGLPQNSVTTMLQDDQGYLWVGTFGGLARFDGERFTYFGEIIDALCRISGDVAFIQKVVQADLI